MPELPEVELTRRNLRRWLQGEKIVAVAIEKTRVIRGASPRAFEKIAAGQRVEAIDRRGKWLQIRFSGGAALFSHLGMTGKWILRDRGVDTLPYERARLDIQKHSVRYRDPRLFGRLIPAKDGEPPPAWRALGPDPLHKKIDGAALKNMLGGKKRSVKEVLMDQSVLAGMGNIQAQEALWRAKIDPRRQAGVLSDIEYRELARGLSASIAHTLKTGAAAELSYVEESGADNPFRIYGRKGEPCPRCRTRLLQIVQGGRSTVYCSKCQR